MRARAGRARALQWDGRPYRGRRRGWRGRAVHHGRDAARRARGGRAGRGAHRMSELDRLYGLPLEDFTPQRDLAARELRRAGDREAAKELAKLPKPTPAAWTANQVARERPELIEALLMAGEELRKAQEEALAGGGGDALRDAMAGQRRCVEAVMAAAESYKPAGRALSRAMADRLRATLPATAADERLSAALAAGRMVDEAQSGGAWPLGLDEPDEVTAAGEGASAVRGGAAAGDEPGAGGRRGRAAAGKGGARGRTTAGDESAAGTGGAPGRTASGDESPAGKGGASGRTAAGDEAAAAAAREAEARAAAERKALQAELRQARGDLRVRERAAAGAEREAEAAREAAAEAAE